MGSSSGFTHGLVYKRIYEAIPIYQFCGGYDEVRIDFWLFAEEADGCNLSEGHAADEHDDNVPSAFRSDACKEHSGNVRVSLGDCVTA
jgi:hypothetical protein